MSSSLEIVLSTLKDKGIYVSREWVSQCIAHIKSKNPTAPATEMSDRVFQHFLTTDYRDCCSEEVNAGNVILASINAADKAIIQSSVVLQIDEIVNVGASREHRNTNTSRLLKLYLTNGKTNVSYSIAIAVTLILMLIFMFLFR